MSLGLAIFASVVLVLAVYNKQFRKFLIYAVVIAAVLGAIGFGGVYVYDRYQSAKYQRHRQAVTACIERNKNNFGDIFDQITTLNGKSLEEQCESDTTLNITPTKTPTTKSSTPGIIPIYGGETLRVVKASEATSNGKVPDFVGVVPLLYLGHNQKFTVTCGSYGDGSDIPRSNPVIEGMTITCK